MESYCRILAPAFQALWICRDGLLIMILKALKITRVYELIKATHFSILRLGFLSTKIISRPMPLIQLEQKNRTAMILKQRQMNYQSRKYCTIWNLVWKKGTQRSPMALHCTL